MSLDPVHAALWLATLAVLAICATTDVQERIIPNEAVIFIALLGIALNLVSRPDSTWISLLVAVLLLGGLLVAAHYNILGAGDGKLIAAMTLFVPPDRIVQLLVEIALAGGVVSAGYLAARQLRARMQALQPNVARAEAVSPQRRHRRPHPAIHLHAAPDTTVPYAVAILLGVGFHVAREAYLCWLGTSCSL